MIGYVSASHCKSPIAASILNPNIIFSLFQLAPAYSLQAAVKHSQARAERFFYGGKGLLVTLFSRHALSYDDVRRPSSPLCFPSPNRPQLKFLSPVLLGFLKGNLFGDLRLPRA